MLFLVLEECLPSQLNEKEAYWMEKISKDKLMNLRPVNFENGNYVPNDSFKRAIGERTKKILADENIRYKVSVNKRKLSPEQINEARTLDLLGNTTASIARKFVVSEDVIGQIVRGKRCTIGPNIDKNLVEKCIQKRKKK